MPDTTKLVAFLAVVAYALGVVTVSFYLQHNDIPDPDLSLFKGHYIYTGLVVLCFLLLSAFIVCACIALYGGLSDLAKAAFLCIGLSLPLWAFYLLILDIGVGSASSGNWLTALEMTALSLVCVGAGIGAYVVFGPTTLRKSGAVVLAIFTVGMTFFYASVYSRHIYPLLPEQFGGGKAKQARVLFSMAGAAEAQQLGIPMQAGRQLSRPVTLLFTGDSFYALRLADNRVVQVTKDDVNGLQEDSTSPYAADVQTRNRGSVVGLPEAGDELVLTFSEEMAPATLVPQWRGEPMEAAIIDKPTVNGVDDLHFTTRNGKTELPQLGTVELRSGQYREFFGSHAIPVTIARNSAEVIVKLNKGADRRGRAAIRPDVMAWTPSPQATDTLGNASESSAVIEIGSEDPSEADVDF